MKVARHLFRWSIGVSLLCHLAPNFVRAQEAVVVFRFDSTLSMVDADLGVQAEVPAGLRYKSGVRDLSVLGGMEAGVRFKEGRPVAIQPREMVANFGRQAFSWSFLFELNDPPLPSDRPLRRSVAMQGLSVSLVNGGGSPWFPVSENGAFVMDGIEIEATGVISVEGSEIRKRTTDLANEWPLELDLSGTLLGQNRMLRLAFDFQYDYKFDEMLVDAQLSLGGSLLGEGQDPFALPVLQIRPFLHGGEVIVSWGPGVEFVLLEDSSPTFSAPVVHTITSSMGQLRFPLQEWRSRFFRAKSAD